MELSSRRRQFTRVLVRAKDGEIQSPDVHAAQKDASEQPVDEVWLVSFRRISPSARAAVQGHSNVLLYTLDDLIEEDVDFQKYFDWLEREVQAADINRLYVPLALTVNEIDAAGNLQDQSKYEDVAAYVDQWLEDNEGEHLLGEFGTGKSWFALKYASDMVCSYREAQERGNRRPRVPLVIRLREYARGFKDVGSLLSTRSTSAASPRWKPLIEWAGCCSFSMVSTKWRRAWTSKGWSTTSGRSPRFSDRAQKQS